MSTKQRIGIGCVVLAVVGILACFLLGRSLQAGVQSHLDQGAAAYYQGRYPEAEREFKQALDLFPDYANGHNNLAMVYVAEKHYNSAERELKTAIQLDPKFTMAYANLSTAYLHQGRV